MTTCAVNKSNLFVTTFFYHSSTATPTPTSMNGKPKNSASKTTIVAVSCTLAAAVICAVTAFVWIWCKNHDKEVNKMLRDIPHRVMISVRHATLLVLTSRGMLRLTSQESCIFLGG